MKRWSPTGGVFAIVFLAFAIRCLVSIGRGDGDPLWILQFLTLPVSYLLVFLSGHVHALFNLSDDVVGWSAAILDVLWGVLMYYFVGWLLERPLRR
jgi:hypothetical protein